MSATANQKPSDKSEGIAGIGCTDGLAIEYPKSLIHEHPSEDVRAAAIRCTVWLGVRLNTRNQKYVSKNKLRND